MPRRVFVYGTLKKGFYNHYLLNASDGQLLGTSKFLGEATTCASFVLLDCGFPYMCDPKKQPNHDANPVRGEVYEVYDNSIMADLDYLEGVDFDHYHRKQIVTEEFGVVDGYIACSENIDYPICPVVDGNYVWRP